MGAQAWGRSVVAVSVEEKGTKRSWMVLGRQVREVAAIHSACLLSSELGCPPRELGSCQVVGGSKLRRDLIRVTLQEDCFFYHHLQSHHCTVCN